MTKYSKELYSNDYMSLFEDGTLGLSDGVGSIDGLEREEVEKLYNALKKIFEQD